MFAGGLILALTLLSLAIWLQWNERLGWPGESFQDREDQPYLKRRMTSRRRIHWIIGGCGVLILIASLAGPDHFSIWVGCWVAVMLSLLTVMLLACLDGFRTHRHLQSKLPKLRRELLGDLKVDDET